jgi:hypothetical protein
METPKRKIGHPISTVKVIVSKTYVNAFNSNPFTYTRGFAKAHPMR